MRKLATFFLILLLGSIQISTKNFEIVIAESTDYISFDSGVTIFSPLNTTYGSRINYLNLTFNQGVGLRCSLNYSIDRNYNGSIPLVTEDTGFRITYKMTGLVTLPELSEGSHCLTIDVLCGLYDFHGANPPGAPFTPTSPGSSDYTATWNHTIYFTIDTSIPEFPSWIILPFCIFITVMVFMIKKRIGAL
jgi:hypothetical protein